MTETATADAGALTAAEDDGRVLTVAAVVGRVTVGMSDSSLGRLSLHSRNCTELLAAVSVLLSRLSCSALVAVSMFAAPASVETSLVAAAVSGVVSSVLALLSGT